MPTLTIYDFLILALVARLASWRPSRVDTESPALRLRRIEEKVDLALAKLGVDFDNVTFLGLSDEVRAAADRKALIEAVRLYREQTGVTLGEAKAVVDEYVNSLRNKEKSA